MKKIYNKLVRDKIPEIIRKDNGIPKTRILDDIEYKEELLKKLSEEVSELIGAKDNKQELKKEIGDVLEVLEYVIKDFGLEKDEVIRLQQERKEKRGGFEQKMFLEETES
jgi:predicted house-cleaning noncanonical NTP pyrophosphatase (MazG superfamily)